MSSLLWIVITFAMAVLVVLSWEPVGRTVAYVVLRPILAPLWHVLGWTLDYLKDGRVGRSRKPPAA